MEYMRKTILRVAGAQMEALQGAHELLNIERWFFLAKKERADIIVFPEQFFQKGITKKTYRENDVAYAKNIFSHLSRKFAVWSVMGSAAEKAGSKFFNRSYLLNSNGNIEGFYDKVFLNGEERDWKTPGDKFPVFPTPWGKIGIMVCRDLLYPKAAMRLAENGAQVIFCPAYWSCYSEDYPSTYRQYVKKGMPAKEVDALVPARAFENGVGVVFVNGAGENKKEILLGKSQVAVPFFGRTKRLEHNKEELLVAEIDLKSIADAKKGYGFS